MDKGSLWICSEKNCCFIKNPIRITKVFFTITKISKEQRRDGILNQFRRTNDMLYIF